MLSGGVGGGRRYPALSVEMMDRIARQAEGYLWEERRLRAASTTSRLCEPPIPFGDAVARSTAQLSRDLRVRAIVVISQSGMSAATMSAARPAAPVVCVSSCAKRPAGAWGCCGAAFPGAPTMPSSPMRSPSSRSDRALARSRASPGHFILLVRWFNADPARNTPSITLLTV